MKAGDIICWQYRSTQNIIEFIPAEKSRRHKSDCFANGEIKYTDAGFNGTIKFSPICAWKIKSIR